MGKSVHFVYISSMVVIVILATIYLSYTGYSYYNTPLEERFYHPHHSWFKPSGIYGHGLGIIGTAMVLFGVVIYIVRKRYGFMARQIRLKYLLEFHIFLCTLGPILVLFHTAFKFGGVVSIAFWSMVAVVLSGVVGRFIYIQIPRTIEGRALSLDEVKNMKADITMSLQNDFNLDENIIQLILGSSKEEVLVEGNLDFVSRYFEGRKAIRQINRVLKNKNLTRKERVPILKLAKNEIALSNKISRLQTMQKLFKYWHVAHLPFALIMLIIVVIHVCITLAFGYKWIF